MIRLSRSRAERCRGFAFLGTIHLLPLLAIIQGVPAGPWIMFGVMYLILSMSVGVGLHRYFAHRAFRTSRGFQLLLALGSSLSFTDPVAFTGKHRLHHRHSDRPEDVHTPLQGFLQCWFGSIVDEGYTDAEIRARARDLLHYPELRWLHRFNYLPGLLFAALVYTLGGWSYLAVGYVAAMALLLNLTSSVNYFCHLYGSRPYQTRDDSRNNFWVALVSFGEGWHNNHHYYPNSARAGFEWWQFDPVYWVIRALQAFGLVWQVRGVPERVRAAAKLGAVQ